MSQLQFFFNSLRWKYSEILISSYDRLLQEFESIPRKCWKSSNADYNHLTIFQKNWFMIPFITKGNRHESNITVCPTSRSLLETVPIYDNCMFSIICGKTQIPPHRGWCDHHYRVHLTIKTDGKSWIRVGDQIRHWQNKEL